VIDPPVKHDQSFYNVNLPPREMHTFRSASFYWARDGQALLFADRRTNFRLCFYLSSKTKRPRMFMC
jgi:hypothetical protein